MRVAPLAARGRKGPCLAALTLLSTCSPERPDDVAIVGDRRQAGLVLETIRAAEAGDRPGFERRIGRSAEPTFDPPAMADVDRTDEGCTLRSIDASLGLMTSVLWSCRNDTKPNVQRTFLVESGRVTHVWNDWVHPPEASPTPDYRDSDIAPPDVPRQVREFEASVRRSGLPGRVLGCSHMVDVSPGRARSNHSYGGICKLALPRGAKDFLVCDDEMVGHFAIAATFAYDRESVVRFVTNNCVGG